MAHELFLGIDLGGTAIKVGLTDGRDGLLGQATVATPHAGPGEVVAAMVVAAAQRAAAAAGVSLAAVVAAGVASPGALDTKAGVVIGAANLPGLKDAPLRELLGAALGVPVVLENDANAAAYGEFVAGAGRASSAQTLVMLTLGTGVGGGIVQGGQLVRGAHDMAAEIGHMLLVPDGRRCGCGQRGCVEAYCSAAATGARAAELLAERAEMSGLRAVLQARGVVTAAEVAAQAAAGDGLAQQVWQETCRWIALACISVTHVVDPDVIVLAGGMSAAGAQLLRPVQEAYAAAWWQTTPVVTELALARLGNDAGMIGVAAAAAAGAHGRG